MLNFAVSYSSESDMTVLVNVSLALAFYSELPVFSLLYH